MYLFALVMTVLNLAAFGIGIRVAFIRHRAGSTRDPAQLRMKQGYVPVGVGRWHSCTPIASKNATNSRFLEKISLF